MEKMKNVTLGRKITGTVKDDLGEAIVGCNVAVKGAEAMVHCLTMCSVVKFYTSEVRLSRHWNGSTTASTYLIAADKPLYIFGGSEIYRLPYIHLLQNNSAPMDRNKNSIQMGYQCKNPFVCCLFIFIYIFVSRSFPLPSAFLSTDIEREKVLGLNTLRRRKILPETACRSDLSTFKGYCTTFADEQRKEANDGIWKLIYIADWW